jgi:hypothetical protein
MYVFCSTHRRLKDLAIEFDAVVQYSVCCVMYSVGNLVVCDGWQAISLYLVD